MAERYCRAEYTAINDDEALAAFENSIAPKAFLLRLSPSCIAHGIKMAAEMNPDQIVLVNLSVEVTRIFML